MSVDTSKDIREQIRNEIKEAVCSLEPRLGPSDVVINGALDSILQVFKEYIEVHKQKLIPNGKIYCNCDCKGPFCNTLMHQCDKPDEHYPQRDQAVIDIQNEVLDRVLEGLEKEKDKKTFWDKQPL